MLTALLHPAPQIVGQSGFVIWTRAGERVLSISCHPSLIQMLNLVSSWHQGKLKLTAHISQKSSLIQMLAHVKHFTNFLGNCKLLSISKHAAGLYGLLNIFHKSDKRACPSFPSFRLLIVCLLAGPQNQRTLIHVKHWTVTQPQDFRLSQSPRLYWNVSE